MQLDCLVSSINENCNIFDDLYVQWTGNMKPDFDLEVEFLYEDFQQKGFKQTLIELIEHIQTPYIAFFVDDNICHRKVDDQEQDDILTALKEVDIFSLRLGKNISIKKHFDYKGSLDGNIYKKEDLLSLADHTFNNPNKLEIQLCKVMKNKMMAYFDRSKVIGVPANKVSTTSTCAEMGVSIELLETMYQAGIRIDYNSMDLHYHNVHKSEPLRFKLC